MIGKDLVKEPGLLDAPALLREEIDMEPPPADEYVTLVEVLELTRPFEEFADAVQAAARRLQAEGVQALVSVQFYAASGTTEVGAILTFADRSRFMEHIELITQWEEFERFFATVKPVDVRVYGKLSPDAEAWARQFDVVSRTFEDHVAGFIR
jgi:hypothetical protein